MTIPHETDEPPQQFVPSGTRAILAYLPDEDAAIRFATAVRRQNWPWLEDVVPAYASVGIFFDPEVTNLAEVRHLLGQLPSVSAPGEEPSRIHLLPCCYEFQLDLQRVCDHKGVTAEEVIRLHTSTEFTVYAVGFCPGFPYLGYLPEALRGVPRLPSPRVRVEPGSVGLTGKQTGLYPLPRPGGWNLIGRTPLQIVDVEANYFPIRVGDRVRFIRIDEQEYHRLDGERL